MTTIVALFLCLVTVTFCWKRPHIGLGLCCVIQVFASTMPSLNWIGYQWLITGALILGLCRVWKGNATQGNIIGLSIIILLGAWVFAAGIIMGAGSGTPFRLAVGITVPLIWGYKFGSDVQGERGWFVGLAIVTAVNFLAIFNIGGLFSFLKPGEIYSMDGVERRDAVTYVHGTAVMCGFLLAALISKLVYWHLNERAVLKIGVRFIIKNAMIMGTILACLALQSASFSRGTLVGLVASGVLLPAFLLGRRSVLIKMVVTIIVLSIILVFWQSGIVQSKLLGVDVFESFEKGISADSQSNKYRLEAILGAWNVIQKQPLFGLGTTSFWNYNLAYPHQLPVSYSLAYGLPVGVIIAGLLVVGFIRPLFLGYLSTKRRRAPWLYTALSLISISALMTNGAMVNGYGFQWWVIGACISYGASRREIMPARHIERSTKSWDQGLHSP
jgi:hypothetical protein